MASISRTRTVAAPAAAVWDVLADFGSISAWAGAVDHSCLLSPASEGIGPGTTRRVQVGRDTLVERITEFQPPHTLGYDVEGFTRQVRHLNNHWTLRPEAGETSVILRTTIEIGHNPVQRIAERVVARFSGRQLDAMLAGLAQRVEDPRV